MAPGKRSRDISDVDGEVEIESASSNFRQNLPKRSRVALAQENGGSVVSDDDDDDDIDEYTEGGATDGKPSEHSESEEDEVNELRATQTIEKQFRELRENIAMEQGVIEEVYCRNFMCHSKLRIKLSPLINFIIGRNGSGKSAVLTALTMCLGGKATSTNRGASLKSLIKEGEESATLAVKIKNQGDAAYKPELYGDSITVERHFSRSGTSGFKLKNWSDKIISTKKADLDDILDFFAFQLDNPINVLTQDMARQFLSNSTPSDKYKFFIRGTQLEMLDQDYQLLEEHLDSMEAKLNSRRQDISVLKRKEEDAERKKKRLEQTRAISDKISHLQFMHAWAQVEEQEVVLETQNRSIQEAEENVQEKTDAAQDAEGAYEGHNQSFDAAKRTLDVSKDQLQPVSVQHRAEKEKLDANKKELTEVVTQERKMRENMKSYKMKRVDLEKEIAAEERRLAGAAGAEHEARLARLEELKEISETKKREQMDHGTGIAELERKRTEASKAFEDGKPLLDQRKIAQRKAEQRLHQLQQERPRPFAGYRPNMDKLVRAIGLETRWRSKPVGPMGQHIKLLKSEWSSQIEKTFGGALDGFIVTNKEDQNMLSQIMRRVSCDAGIFIGDANRLDTTGKEPSEDVDTILRVLEIDSDAVRNQLIVAHYIDQTVLITNPDEARKYAGQSPRAQNVRAVICIHKHERKRGIRYEWSRSGAPKTSPVYPWDGESRMKSDREDQIRSQREDVEQARNESHSAEQEQTQVKNAFEKAKQEVVRFKRRQSELVTESQEAEDAVEDQKNEIEKHRPQDGKLQALQEQLQGVKGDLEAEENSFGDMVVAKDSLNAQAVEINAGVVAAQAELDQATRRVTQAEGRLSQAMIDRENALKEKNLVLEQIDKARAEVEKLEGKRDTQQGVVYTFTTTAMEICSRRIAVEEGLSAGIIDKRIEKLVKDVERAEREVGGTKAELTAAWLQAKHDYEEAEAQMKGMNKCADILKETLANRHYRWKKFRQLISMRARLTFGYLLSERQFRGRVLMNHQTKELDIKVEPDLSKNSDAGRATKTLSGGEKSFSTICLLLSIWEAMGSPIRCLDEFDVFMDSVNRATSMSMMINAARRSVGRQFILITPQSMNNVDCRDDVRVHKMSDPERGQTTLPYGGTQA